MRNSALVLWRDYPKKGFDKDNQLLYSGSPQSVRTDFIKFGYGNTKECIRENVLWKLEIRFCLDFIQTLLFAG